MTSSGLAPAAAAIISLSASVRAFRSTFVPAGNTPSSALMVAVTPSSVPEKSNAGLATSVSLSVSDSLSVSTDTVVTSTVVSSVRIPSII